MKSMAPSIFALTEFAAAAHFLTSGARALGRGFPLFGGCGVAAPPGESGGTVLKTHSTRSRLLASTLVCSAQAMAQDQGTQVEEFVVTGSRIPQPNLTSTSPITVVGDAEAKLQGTTNVESLINNLPAAFADFTSTAPNGATG